jgi:nucleotidyltransferase substrate binding protein (TIGR01987 family)
MTGKNKDIRWQQRFSNYLKALTQLNRYKEKDELNDMERQGLIKAFEFTFELAWNTLKDYLEHQGIQNLVGSRDAIRQAF